jgi:hypothetical protein
MQEIGRRIGLKVMPAGDTRPWYSLMREIEDKPEIFAQMTRKRSESAGSAIPIHN